MSASSSDTLSILVMGVGRSGTTAIYGLLQRILEVQFPGDVDFVYEPFLWERSTFNKPYTELTDEFTFVSSLSVEGIYHHKQLPMLVTADSRIDQNSRDWLRKTLTPSGGRRHYLGKMIRANGRIRLIRELAPTTKIIFVMRNPVDVLNSATQMFSFYGKEFYESDFDRYTAEIEARFQTRIEVGSHELTAIKAEYGYWYFENLAFLEYARSNPNNIFSVSYEAFVENRADLVRRICEFAGVEFNPQFPLAAEKALGPVKQNTSALNKDEFDYLREKIETYKGLLEFVDCAPSAPIEQLLKVTRWTDVARIRNDSPCFSGFHTSKKLQEVELRLAQLENEHVQIASDLSKILASKRYRFISWLLAPLDRLK